MPAHPIDFQIQTAAFATTEGLTIYDEQARFQRWLDFEAALAGAQAELGIIPAAAAREIANQARVEALDLEAVGEEYTRNRNSLTPILKGLRRACGPKTRQFVHYGATTQDVLDTGEVLALKEVLALSYRDLRAIEETLLALITAHAETPMIGRTHSQQAVPITLGLKAAGWAMELRRDIERIKGLAGRVLVGQCGGAVGSMTALGAQGREVARRTMTRLGLAAPPLPWHTARDNMAEAAAVLQITVSGVARIANEIFQLGKTEIGELREGSKAGTSAGSSTMPHKRNPVLCERIMVLERQVRAMSSVVAEAMIHENERDPRMLWSEWLALPQLAIHALAALAHGKTVVANLEVFPEQMLANLRRYPQAIISEWLVFTLAPALGREGARERVGGLLATGADLKAELADVLDDNTRHLIDQPERCTGLATELAQDACALIREHRDNEAATLFPEGGER